MEISLSQLLLKISFVRSFRFLFPVALLVLSFIFLRRYIQGTSMLIAIGMAAIWSVTVKQQTSKSCRWAIAALLMLAITALVPVKTLLYMAIGLSVFFWIELHYASIGVLGFAALLLSSPAFQYSAAVFSFPIRLHLTKMVGVIFSIIGNSTQTKGNTILNNGNEFSVDPACAGLHMLSISLLMGIFLMGLLQKKSGKAITWKAALIYLICLVIFNLVANVFRIILLVQFAVPPGVIMHDVIGLACLLLYVCLPACYFAKYFIAKAPTKQESIKKVAKGWTLFLQVIIIIGLLATAFRVSTTDTYSNFENKYNVLIAGYTSSVYAPGIIKIEGKEAFAYIKFIRGFYDTEHNPTLCWKGSGYEFKDVKTQRMGKKEIYTAVLSKDTEKLYTAWWYDNGIKSTSSQWQWRCDMLKGAKGYALINVTAGSRAALTNEIKKILVTNALQPLF